MLDNMLTNRHFWLIYQDFQNHLQLSKRIPLKVGGELRCSGGVSSCYSTKSTTHISLVTNRMTLERNFASQLEQTFIFGLRYGDRSANTKKCQPHVTEAPNATGALWTIFSKSMQFLSLWHSQKSFTDPYANSHILTYIL